VVRCRKSTDLALDPVNSFELHRTYSTSDVHPSIRHSPLRNHVPHSRSQHAADTLPKHAVHHEDEATSARKLHSLFRLIMQGTN